MGISITEDKIFQWKDQYCIGVEEIDNAHQQLFSIVRRLVKNLESGDYDKNKTTCLEAIKFLKQHTVEHFAQEEEFQLKVGYSGYENHKRMHDNMREVTIPALEKQMLSSDFSVESVEHFVGVCSAWLSAHIMFEDQAITGKIKSRWDVDFRGDELEILKTHAEEFMSKLFQVNIDIESVHYEGYDLGDVMPYYQIVKASDNTIHRTIIIPDKKLICSNISQLMGTEMKTLNEIAMSMFEELAYTFVTNFIYKYTGNNDLTLLSNGMVEKNAFKADFESYHPDVSMLWHTAFGHIAFCMKSVKIGNNQA
ncbi:MAG: hemerythrin domain-containing protein [Firmicutes bacterium]|nr:hemerythrin domain-containing protein [[Eubacterium] siraeum]MCM1487119.1 hemerythrin domain-containing protein [Bacillota bacterium]